MDPDLVSAISGAVGVAAATPVALLVARAQIRAVGQQAITAHQAVDGAQIQTSAAEEAQAREARRTAYIPFTAAAHELYELLRTQARRRDAGDLPQLYRDAAAVASRAAALVDLEGPDFLADLAHDVLRKAGKCMDVWRKANELIQAEDELSDLLTSHCQIDQYFVSRHMWDLRQEARKVPAPLREAAFKQVVRPNSRQSGTTPQSQGSPAEAEIAGHVETLRRVRQPLYEAIGQLPAPVEPPVRWTGRGLQSARYNAGLLTRYAITNAEEMAPLNWVIGPLGELREAVSEFVKQARACLHEGSA
ncbi:hypothetical protein H1V43_39160 [Streptomyces sp. PSKA54]|uniref:Uncharacterized protein n=1 Tax=Streptomyces himalayensis subsp. aureolus TaxID=2758039 RepID=A0A7W2D9G2_9ACTN|nr:hypothetical protein [Streptomyces himalayensis]MBA4867198.1 hypothetical protein [Streptomyces himalayensis subsp. aureolus]